MKRFYLYIISVSLLFISCIIPKTPYENIGAKTDYWIIPPINMVTTSSIGDSLLKEGTKTTTEAIILNKDDGAPGWTAYHPSGTYKLKGKANKVIENSADAQMIPCKIYEYDQVFSNGWTYVFPQILEDPDGKVYLSTNGGPKLINNHEYNKTNIIDTNDYYFEQQLIFTGSEGKILKFSYREFVGDTARSAYTIDATYDLSKENTIRFKGAVLEIQSYDNQSITYKVLSGFKTN